MLACMLAFVQTQGTRPKLPLGLGSWGACFRCTKHAHPSDTILWARQFAYLLVCLLVCSSACLCACLFFLYVFSSFCTYSFTHLSLSHKYIAKVQVNDVIWHEKNDGSHDVGTVTSIRRLDDGSSHEKISWPNWDRPTTRLSDRMTSWDVVFPYPDSEERTFIWPDEDNTRRYSYPNQTGASNKVNETDQKVLNPTPVIFPFDLQIQNTRKQNCLKLTAYYIVTSLFHKFDWDTLSEIINRVKTNSTEEGKKEFNYKGALPSSFGPLILSRYCQLFRGDSIPLLCRGEFFEIGEYFSETSRWNEIKSKSKTNKLMIVIGKVGKLSSQQHAIAINWYIGKCGVIFDGSQTTHDTINGVAY